jgi:hypothetical protein
MKMHRDIPDFIGTLKQYKGKERSTVHGATLTTTDNVKGENDRTQYIPQTGNKTDDARHDSERVSTVSQRCEERRERRNIRHRQRKG